MVKGGLWEGRNESDFRKEILSKVNFLRDSLFKTTHDEIGFKFINYTNFYYG